jgi:hypothetical protein
MCIRRLGMLLLFFDITILEIDEGLAAVANSHECCSCSPSCGCWDWDFSLRLDLSGYVSMTCFAMFALHVESKLLRKTNNTSSQVAYSIETIFPMIISWKIPGCSISYDFMSSWERSFSMAGMDLEGKFNDFTTLAASNSLGKDLCFKCVPEKVYALFFIPKKTWCFIPIYPNVLKICPWNPTGVSMSVHTCIHTTFCNPLSIVSRGNQHETETDFFATVILWTCQKLSCIKSVSFYNHLWLRVSAGAQSLCEGVSHHGL